MSKHWSDGLELIDPEEYRWQNATTSMMDEFDEDKIKYMVTLVSHPHMLLQSFSEEFQGKIITGAFLIKKEQIHRGDIKELIKQRIGKLKNSFAEYKKNLTQ